MWVERRRRLLDMVRGRTPVDPRVVPWLRLLRGVWVWWHGANRHRLPLLASGMTYTVLMALVPLLLLVFGVLHAVGVLDQDAASVERLVFGSFLGNVPEVKAVLLPGLMAVDLRALGVVGVSALMFVCWQLFEQVEAAYNTIFETVKRRTIARRLVMFWVMLTLLPVLGAVLWIRASEILTGVTASATPWAALLLEGVAFASALRVLPTTTVRWSAVAAGALTSTALLYVASSLFALYLQLLMPDNPVVLIYGSLGVLPAFLLWLYLTSLAVLVGVEVAAVVHDYAHLFEVRQAASFEAEHGDHGPGLDAALVVAAVVADAFQRGEGPVAEEVVAQRAGLPNLSAAPVIDTLVQAGLLARTHTGVLLTRAPGAVPLTEVAAAWHARTAQASGHGPWLEAARSHLDGQLTGTLTDAVAAWRPPSG